MTLDEAAVPAILVLLEPSVFKLAVDLPVVSSMNSVTTVVPVTELPPVMLDQVATTVDLVLLGLYVDLVVSAHEVAAQYGEVSDVEMVTEEAVLLYVLFT